MAEVQINGIFGSSRSGTAVAGLPYIQHIFKGGLLP
jgi:hypothetical protein